MATYLYQAIDPTGAILTGELEVDSLKQVNEYLSVNGYIPLSITIGKHKSLGGWISRINESMGKVKASELIIFTQQFRSMYRAGIPIARTLNTLEIQSENPVLKKTLASISHEISKGATLAEAMDKHPKVFSPLYRSMVNAGEVSGSLPAILDRLIFIIEHEVKIKSDIKEAIQYPIIVALALIAAFFILLTFVIPKLAAVFLKAKIALPLPTRMAIGLYWIISHYGVHLFIGFVLLVIFLKYYINTDEGRYQRDKFLLRLPILGSLFLKTAMSRFASIFSILSSSGIPIIQTISIIKDTIGNSVIGRSLSMLKEKIEKGEGISGPLKEAGYFPPMVVDMVAIGEESGKLDEMLSEVSRHYDDEIAYAVKGLSGALEPILIVCLTVVVGFFALAIYMPIWDLAKIGAH